MTKAILKRDQTGQVVCPSTICIRCGKPATSSQDLSFHKKSQWLVFLKGRLLADVGSSAVTMRAPFCKKHSYYFLWPWLLFAMGAGVLVGGLFVGSVVVLIGMNESGRRAAEDLTLGSVTISIGLISGTLLLWYLRRSTIWPVAIRYNQIELAGVAPQFAEAARSETAAAAAVATDYATTAPGSARSRTEPIGARKISVGVVGFALGLLVLIARVLLAFDVPDLIREICVVVFPPAFLIGPSFCVASLIRKDKAVLGVIGLIIFGALFFEFLSNISKM